MIALKRAKAMVVTSLTGTGVCGSGARGGGASQCGGSKGVAVEEGKRAGGKPPSLIWGG
jgi:hypothetical protein